MNKKTITQFLNQEYKEYSLYTIEQRAIPSCIDGFKNSQRKIICIADRIWRTGSEKPLKVYQLGGKVASDCLHYDTEILLKNGSSIKIGDWFNSPDLILEVKSVDSDGNFVDAIGYNPISSLHNEYYEITTEDGKVHKMTGNHLVMLISGEWVKVKDLNISNEIKSLNKGIIENIIKIKLTEPVDFYDISVDDYHNFVINDSIVVHNCHYHHGDASLQSAITVMVQNFKNNLPLFDAIGQFGELKSPTAGAPRYIGCKLNKNFRYIYKDFELLTHKEEEGNQIEAKFYLPIIPMVLVNGSSGIGVGFATNILNRDPLDVIKCTLSFLKNGKLTELKPKLNGFIGEWINDTENHKKWFIRGAFIRVNSNTIRVIEIVPTMTYEKYDEHLESLIDKKMIVSYEDNSKGSIDYSIKFTKDILATLDDEKLIKLLKLEESSTENFNTVDENGKLRIFDTADDILKYFVNFRLTYYSKRKDYLLNKIQNELNILKNKGRFIKYILDNKLEVKNEKKETIINNMVILGLDKLDDSYDYLLRMPIYSLTLELYEKLKSDFSAKREESAIIEATDPKDMYINDLKDLYTKIK